MSRLLNITSFTVFAFLGGVLATFGIRSWFTAHRTTMTLFDTIPNDDPDVMRIDNCDPWIDTGFLSQKAFAVMILLLGIGIFSWAATQLFRKPVEPPVNPELTPSCKHGPA